MSLISGAFILFIGIMNPELIIWLLPLEIIAFGSAVYFTLKVENNKKG